MFENQKFLTRGVMAEIPPRLIHLMWYMILTMETDEKDYLQVFILTKTPTGQHIVHTQEPPPHAEPNERNKNHPRHDDRHRPAGRDSVG